MMRSRDDECWETIRRMQKRMICFVFRWNLYGIYSAIFVYICRWDDRNIDHRDTPADIL